MTAVEPRSTCRFQFILVPAIFALLSAPVLAFDQSDSDQDGAHQGGLFYAGAAQPVHEPYDLTGLEIAAQPSNTSQPAANTTWADGMIFPLRNNPAIRGYSFVTVHNYVDNNPANPGSVSDFMCGSQTYDVNGYDHSGIDIVPNPDRWTPYENHDIAVIAALGGTVVSVTDGNVDSNCRSSVFDGQVPNVVIVQHDDNTRAFYVHLAIGSSQIVQVGQRVEQGDLLGYIGSSGTSFQPHLHFEVQDTQGNILDTMAGPCGATVSAWRHQWGYQVDSVSRIQTHSAAPRMFVDRCTRPEWNLQEDFQPGSSGFLGIALAQFSGSASGTIEVFQPDGAMHSSFPLAEPNLQNNSLYSAYWTEPLNLAANSPSGVWEIRVTLDGQVYSDSFSVGGAPPNAAVRAALLPSSRSVVAGTGVATAFVTVLNIGSNNAENCWIGPDVPLNAIVHYQTTDPATNGLTGSRDVPVDIPAGGSQTFLISIEPASGSTARSYTVNFNIRCANTDDAPVIDGVNTLLLNFGASSTPDIVAISTTPSGDGQLRIPGDSAAAAFAVATANVGSAGAMTVRPRLSDGTIPANLDICRTDSGGGCVTARAASVQQQYDPNETYSYAVFVRSTGAIPASPASRRVVVEIADSGGIVRGSTSVAVRTN